ncbi:MAG: hypothetical protein YK1309IOTA_680011 [Marine Group I thaumarchaeote]|nr:MAG: hypothetical protein YK1309IOTA_680011 [Marine Group I thaumarchaeote]
MLVMASTLNRSTAKAGVNIIENVKTIARRSNTFITYYIYKS